MLETVAGEVGVEAKVTAKCVRGCVGLSEAVIYSYYWRTVDETLKSNFKGKKNTSNWEDLSSGNRGFMSLSLYFCPNGRGRKGGFAAAKGQI